MTGPIVLDELTAANLGLIAHAEVRLDPGLTVITGETGTGKTLLLGALRLLRGDKAPKTIIGPHATATEVSARFLDDADERVVRRTIDERRSRAYLDGSAATASDLAGALAGRVAIIGQHDQLTLTSARGVRGLIDRRLDAEGRAARDRYTAAWAAWTGVKEEMHRLGGDPRELERERDIAAYQVEEIDHAAPDPDVDHDLRDRIIALRNADTLLVDLDRALTALGDDGAGGSIDTAVAALRSAGAFDAGAEALAGRTGEVATQVNELARDLAVRASAIEADPAVLAAAEERLAMLGTLTRKYGDTLEDVLSFRKEAAERRERLGELIAAAADIDERLDRAEAAVRRAGDELRAARCAAASSVADDAVEHLRDLGFTGPVVRIEVADAEPTESGADQPIVRFASTEDLDPAPVSAIASGGELSRLVLALSLAAGFSDASTLAFDEIDSGIGGATALAMGEKLRRLAGDRQVVCVTHLPQVAAFADRHLTVARTGSTAEIRDLDDEQRLSELTRMLSGLSESVPGLDHARELLEHAQAR